MAWSWKNLFGFGGDESRNKGGSSFQYQPYGGLRPPRIDYTKNGQNVEILRPTQQQIFDLLMSGSKGQGVGYAQERKSAAIALLESKLGKQREDDIRAAEGRVASSGLSGNLRAQEALTGRVNRDYGRTLGEGVNALNIEDLGVQQREREADKRALQVLNSFNFGQENKAADFDLSAYGQEQGNRAQAFGINEGVRQYDQGQSDEFFNSLLQAGGTVAGSYFGGPAGAAIGSQAAQALTGKGIAPQDYINTSSGTGVRKPGRAYRSLTR